MKASFSSFPDFFILGAAKCGTTSLHDWLGQHSEICMSQPKEPLFFESEFEEGVEHYRRTCFAHCPPHALTGEARHRNFYLPYVPSRIAQAAPDAKFILLFRDPVSRAYSHWWHHHAAGHDPLPFDSAVQEDLARIERGEAVQSPEQIDTYIQGLRASKLGRHRTYLDTGYYAQQLERWWRHFPPDRFLVLIFERVVRQPAEAVEQVCRFLGIDASQARGFDYATDNAARVVPLRRAWRRALYRSCHGLMSGRLVPPRVLRRRPRMSPETRRWLIEHYHPRNQRLREVLADPIPEWLSPD